MAIYDGESTTIDTFVPKTLAAGKFAARPHRCETNDDSTTLSSWVSL
jgi:hypothetical protein